MGGFIFKQRTASHAPRAAIPGLNVRHLHYIATRPGAEFNPECGFSLWGSLEPFQPPENIQNLARAEQMVLAESRRGRTMFRGIISLGEPEAGERDYYRREKWQRLSEPAMAEIAKQAHIDPAKLRWVAAMHNTQGHPHMHLLYWDAGNEPRADFIPPERFQIFAENVRAAVNRVEYGEEIQNAQAEQTARAKSLRLEMQALFRDCNPAGSLDVKGLYRQEKKLAQLQEQLETLVQELPQRGSLKYAYLSPDYKKKLDAFTEEVLGLSGCRELKKQYLAATEEISGLYGNGQDTAAYNQQRALDRLHRELGNEIMSQVRLIRRELAASAPESPEELHALAVRALEQLPEEKLADLLRLLPPDRIPISEMDRFPGFQAEKQELLHSLLEDARIRIPLEAAAKKGDPKETYAAFFRTAEQELTRQLREVAGYTREQRLTQTVCAVNQAFMLLSRLTGQQRAAAQTKRLYSRDKSREARQDQAQRSAQGQGWEPDI